MGQAATREHRHSSDEPSSSASGPSYPATVDGGALEPQGVYPGPHDYSHDVVKSAIVQRKLMPFYKGQDDEDVYSGQVFNTECPICFLYYPSTLNQTRCCAQPICTECFVEIRRADPNHTNPPSSQPAECPFCTADNFGVVFVRPNLSPVDEQHTEGSASPTHSRRKSFAHTSPDVLTTDIIRPDWSQKLAAAQATILRRANRRIIMRQVGERLIPIGVSSSRVGAELPEGTGPGGAIILREGEEWGPFGAMDNGPRNRRSSRRGGAGDSGIMQLAGQDVEEMMMMEAMRLSLLEHEEQQRRQSQQESRRSGSVSGVPLQNSALAPSTVTAQASIPSTNSSAGVTRSSSTSRGQPMAPASGRANRLSQDIRNATSLGEVAGSSPSRATGNSGLAQSPPRSHTGSNMSSHSAATTSPRGIIDFGLRDDVLGELAELIDEPNDEMRRRIEASQAVRQAKDRAAEESAQEQQYTGTSQGVAPPPSATEASSRETNSRAQMPTSAAFHNTASPRLTTSSTSSPAATPPGSPSTSSRPLSPNNPFRARLGGSSGSNTPVRGNTLFSGTAPPSPFAFSPPNGQQRQDLPQ